MKHLVWLASALLALSLASAACGVREETALPACKGADPSLGGIVSVGDTPCSSAEDCQTGGRFCYSGGPYWCGYACAENEITCQYNGDCGADQACVDKGCCGGKCVQMKDRCDAGAYTCPENHDCKPTDGYADVHGCAPRECKGDAECDCGACVNGSCAKTIGYCVPLSA